MQNQEKDLLKKLEDDLRRNLQRIEGIKNLIRDGKIVVAYEKLQGVGDALAFTLGVIINKRRNANSSSENDDSSVQQ